MTSSFTDHGDSGDSTHSLLSTRRPSEMGSQYLFENGVYMSSFVATIFVGALVTIGILMLILLVALTVMLDSCQNTEGGVVKWSKTSVQYEYCKFYAFHAELNNLEADEFPTFCKQNAPSYTEKSQFLLDFNLTAHLAKNYFSTIKPDKDHLSVILMDADDINLLNTADDSISSELRRKQDTYMKYITSSIVLRLYVKLQASGWSVVFFTRKPTSDRNATIESLNSAGFGGWTSLIMRSNEEVPMESWKYISDRRVQLHNQGFQIESVISSQMDAFRGPCLGKRNFKLAYPIYYKLEQ